MLAPGPGDGQSSALMQTNWQTRPCYKGSQPRLCNRKAKSTAIGASLLPSAVTAGSKRRTAAADIPPPSAAADCMLPPLEHRWLHTAVAGSTDPTDPPQLLGQACRPRNLQHVALYLR